MKIEHNWTVLEPVPFRPVQFLRDLRVGILGGGQLARMLAEAASRLGLCPVVLSDRADSPAARVCPDRVLGAMDDPAALSRFLSGVDLVVFENEFVDTSMLEDLNLRLPSARPFFPSLAALAKLRDKLGQKELLAALGIPGAPFRSFHSQSDDPGELPRWIDESAASFGGSCVLKWGRMGYDGKGVFFLDDPRAQREPAGRFCELALQRGISLFAERKIPFRRELAMVGCRSVSGEFLAYPLVISEQKNGVCLDVIGPAGAFGVPAEKEREAREAARRIAESGGLVGCFAIELFETPEGELWVNEMAPRVHNSGHYTQDACATSQFENHWRAILGLPLGAPQPRPVFLMGNLLGPPDGDERGPAGPLPVPAERWHLHWYGKELRPWRKMGHLNGSGNSPADAGALREELRRCRDRWTEELRGERVKR